MALSVASQDLLARFDGDDSKPIQEMTPAEGRALGSALKDLHGAGPELPRVEEVSIPRGDGDVPARLYVPGGELVGMFVYLHGGGWVIGTLDQFDALARKIAHTSRVAVLLVDYRLAPEHPYPAALDDADAAVRWAADHGEELLGARLPLIVGGDSAGGNLAAAVTQRARENGPQIDLQVLIYPVTDYDTDTSSYRNPDNQLMVNRDAMEWYWEKYVADAGQRRSVGASPLRAADFTGLPPAIMMIAEYDPLRDEGQAYAHALRSAGVPVSERFFWGEMHGFFTMTNILPSADTALDHLAAELSHHLSDPATVK